jgi:NAD-dependent dihydropyrimidine dehydrogenase PreA subunit
MPKEITLSAALPLMEQDLTDYPHPVYIFEAWCKGCEICVALCPKGSLEMGRDKIARLARPETCTSCKLCELWCPDFCITVLPKKKKSGSGEGR